MNEKLKSKLYLLVFLLAAGILGWGIWNNYRPQVILASCTDIADRSNIVFSRTTLIEDQEANYNNVLQDCLRDAGVN